MRNIYGEVNQLTVCKDEYSSPEEFENAVKKAIMFLLDNGYIMTVKYDVGDKEMGIVVIDYNYADEEFGCYYPCWLSPDEIEVIEAKEYENYESNC